MTQLLAGRTALVTGGGTGIGRGIALALAGAGARVALTYRTHTPDDELAERVAALSGAPLTALRMDATDEQQVVATVRAVTGAVGPLDVLVNNVGGLVRRSAVADMDAALWREVMSVNLDSTFLVTHHALPVLRHPARVISIASLAGRTGGHPGATAYAAAKAGIFGFTRGLAKELAATGTTVNAVAPGFIEDTPFHDTFTTAESKAATVAAIPAGRAGTPEDVAGTVVWLASDLSRFVTGAVIDVNGGQHSS